MENNIVLHVGPFSAKDACTMNGSLLLIEEIETELGNKKG